ncbi:hypothetical protein [Streptomyces sp. NPDC058657]|uniref:hypothetical protein n=1 Tax=unclassified Streptomyces TaxID=2593676 RepID=UPI0036678F3D
MVSSPHEASHRIFQERPELLTPVFDLLGVPLPKRASIEVLSADATEIRPLERRVDSVLRVTACDGPTFLLAIEAQGGKKPEKESSWAYYLAYLHAKYDCPALLLVVCQDTATAKWAGGPFRMGIEGWTALTTHPLVLGPDNVPLITDSAQAGQDLALATFSAMTHGKAPDPTAILEALAIALGAADSESAAYYSELLEIGLGDSPARAIWRKMMSVVTYFPGRGTYRETAYLEGKAEGKAEGEAEGRAQGVAESVLRVLDVRRVPLTDDDRVRIMACTDLTVLDRWVALSVTINDVADLWAVEAPPEK